MAETPAMSIWLGRAGYLGAVAALVFLQLLPLRTTPLGWAPPDMILAVTLAVVARRPDYAPVWLVALVFFLTDLLFHRPPGLAAALVILGTEALRNRARGLRAMPFPVEWATVAVIAALIALGQRLALALVMLPQARLGLALSELMLTLLAYPLVVAAAHLLFGLRRPATGEVDALGHRL